MNSVITQRNSADLKSGSIDVQGLQEDKNILGINKRSDKKEMLILGDLVTMSRACADNLGWRKGFRVIYTYI